VKHSRARATSSRAYRRWPLETVRALKPPLLAATVVLAVIAHGSAAGAACDRDYSASPQFSAAECVFQNAQNPKATPSQPPWKIWTRFLQPADPASMPVDPIPVRKLDRAQLDALDHEIAEPAGQEQLCHAHLGVAISGADAHEATLAARRGVIGALQAHREELVGMRVAEGAELGREIAIRPVVEDLRQLVDVHVAVEARLLGL